MVYNNCNCIPDRKRLVFGPFPGTLERSRQKLYRVPLSPPSSLCQVSSRSIQFPGRYTRNVFQTHYNIGLGRRVMRPIGQPRNKYFFIIMAKNAKASSCFTHLLYTVSYTHLLFKADARLNPEINQNTRLEHDFRVAMDRHRLDFHVASPSTMQLI